MKHSLSYNVKPSNALYSFKKKNDTQDKAISNTNANILNGSDTHHSDKDVAAELVPEYAQPIDPAVERQVVRKIDIRLLPFMWMGFGLVYYDKAILGSAAILGMIEDLSLSTVNHNTVPPTISTSRLSWATSICYFGMLCGLYPLTFLLQRFHQGKTLGCVIILWGMVAMLTAAVTSWKGLFVQRFFLGFIESVVPTAFLCIISGYYTQDEQALRQSWWYSASGGWTIIGSALSYGFGHISSGSLRTWQYLYLLAGGLTTLFGVYVCFIFPDSAATAGFLTADQRVVAIERLRKGQTGVRCRKIKGYQVRESFLDIKIWIYFAMITTIFSVSGAILGFGPLIVSTFGYTPLQAILLQFPSGALSFIAILLTGYLSTRIRKIRLLLVVICCLPVIIGCVMMWKSQWTYHAPVPVIGFTILGIAIGAASTTMATSMSNVSGASKKSFTAAACFVGNCLGNIFSSQLVKTESRRDHYPELWQGIIICYCIAIALACLLYFLLSRENARRDQLTLLAEEADRVAFLDLTDKENLHFRYVW